MIDIHNTAIIEEGAIIEDGVKIGPYCIIGKDVKLVKYYNPISCCNRRDNRDRRK